MYSFNVETKSPDYQADYKGRTAKVKAQRGGMVLYDVYRGDKAIVENYILPEETFFQRYK
jgi:hypothetical protein